MLTLTVTALVSVFFLGPSLLFRRCIGFLVQPKNLVQSKGEEIIRALVWVTLPLLLAVFWALASGHLQQLLHLQDALNVMSGEDSGHTAIFKDSLYRLLWSAWCVFWRLYLITLLEAAVVIAALLLYRPLRRNAVTKLLSDLAIKTAPIAEWYFLLSDRFTLSPHAEVHVDVLSKSGTLYQGRVERFTLDATGALQLLVLKAPRRFKKQEFDAAREGHPHLRPERFWRDIPGNFFVVPAGEIANLNLRVVDIQPLDKDSLNPANEKLLRDLIGKVTQQSGKP